MSISNTRWTWISGARAGDDDAVRALFLKYRPAVVGWFVRRGQPADAEDLAQEVFLRLFDRVLSRADRAKGRFRSLLFAISQNVLGSHLRRRQALKRGGANGPVALGDQDVAAPVEEDFDREWIVHLIELAMQRLEREHPTYQQALAACTLGDESQADLAARLGVEVQTIKNRVSRGKKKLSAYLREEVWSYACTQDEYSVELEVLARFLPE